MEGVLTVVSTMLLQASANALPLRDESVQCVVTSPPYWGGVRLYAGEAAPWGVALGNERRPEDYVCHLVEVFREVRRVLRYDGTLWLNLGDIYAASGKGGGGRSGSRPAWAGILDRKGSRMPPPGYKQKDLTLVAFQVANALRIDGWYLRQTVIWRKPHATEPMRLDRPAVAHEYLFLLAKSEHYAARDPGEPWWGQSVWDISIQSVPGHPAVMPEELARRALVAGSRPGDLVLDPFNGSGTTGRVAVRLGRSYVGVDISREYLAEQTTKRLDGVQLEAFA